MDGGNGGQRGRALFEEGARRDELEGQREEVEDEELPELYSAWEGERPASVWR